MPYLARGKPFSAHVSRSIDKSGALGRVEENRVQVEEEGEEEAGDGDGERVHRGRRKCYLLWHKSKRERGRHEERLGGWRDETSGGEEGLPSFTSSASFVTDFFSVSFWIRNWNLEIFQPCCTG